MNSSRVPVELELLAPARDAATGRIAVDCGADAVYIGPEAFGARAAAGNSTADIGSLVDYAHGFGVRVYATTNTILLDSELEAARRQALDLYNVGVDALIVQDMAYLEMNLPIALHASTQCDIRTPQKAAWLAQAGFRRLVLPREFTPAQIGAAAAAAGVPVEVFIHGARCVSYSGDCQMGFAATGRSANRGVCPQMCRLPYELVDGGGVTVAPRRHYLSLSDLNTPDIGVLAAAGASSFKIEGRLKDRRYVANTVAWYSRQLDKLIDNSGGRYCRSSFGKSVAGFTPDISKGFFRRPNGGGLEACLASPNDTGSAVGRVTASFSPRSRSFKVSGAVLANGDGLGFFDDGGSFHGFRLNRADGNECFPAAPLPQLKKSMPLFRNFDKAFSDAIDAATTRRTVRVDFRLDAADGGFCLSATAENGISAVTNCAAELSTARLGMQTEQRRNTLARLGDTHFSLGDISDNLGDLFVPASLLAAARRDVLQQLDKAVQSHHIRETPGKCLLPDNAFTNSGSLSYHDNIANAAAEHFYRRHGATSVSPALECGSPADTAGKRVMATRYCIRRELGACLRRPAGRKLPSPLFLRNEYGTWRIDFDCKRCGMDIVKVTGKPSLGS